MARHRRQLHLHRADTCDRVVVASSRRRDGVGMIARLERGLIVRFDGTERYIVELSTSVIIREHFNYDLGNDVSQKPCGQRRTSR